MGVYFASNSAVIMPATMKLSACKMFDTLLSHEAFDVKCNLHP